MNRPTFKNPAVEVSRLLENRLREILNTLIETELLRNAQEAAKIEPKFAPLVAPLLDMALPDSLWTAAEWEDAIREAETDLAPLAKAGNPIDPIQAELDRRALLRLCAEYRVARRMGTKATKAWLRCRSMIEALALAPMEGMESRGVKVLIGLLNRELRTLNPDE
jgi:hypothetical protein